MSRGNGTGPWGEGPMTGRGMGFCVLKKGEESPNLIEGFIGIEGKPYEKSIKDKKEVTIMPGGDGTGPAGMGSMTGRAAGYCAGYPVPGFMNPNIGWGARGYGQPFYHGLAAYPSAPYAPVTPFNTGYPRIAWGRGRGGSRGWGRGRGFRSW